MDQVETTTRRPSKRSSEPLSGFLAITDGPKGVYWLEGDELRHMPAFESTCQIRSAPAMLSTAALR